MKVRPATEVQIHSPYILHLYKRKRSAFAVRKSVEITDFNLSINPY